MLEKRGWENDPPTPSSFTTDKPATGEQIQEIQQIQQIQQIQEIKQIKDVAIEKPQKAVLRSPNTLCPSIPLSSPSQLSVDACCAPYAPASAAATSKMGLSKSHRIIVLLVIDSAFFLLELVVGKVHSLTSIFDRIHF